MKRPNGWTLFTLRGVPLNLDFSLMFLLIYVLLIASIQFPLVVRQSGIDIADIVGPPFFWGIIFAFSLLVSIFLHEFSHVLVAQSYGAKARRITLMMLGGISEMEKLPEKPSAEINVALAGPLLSLALGGLLLLLYWFSDSPNLALFGFWIGQLNLVLGIFNLLPAFPTDGGRVLRSILVSRQGRVRGTQNAVRVSRVFALFFGLVGLLNFNIILILIAFFIYIGSQSELFYVMAQYALKGMKVRDVFVRTDPIPENASVLEAAKLMVDERSTALPVANSGPPYGIVNVESLQRVPKSLWGQTSVRNIQSEVPISADIDEPLDELLTSGQLSNWGIPVTEDGNVIGLVRMSDILETIQLREVAGMEERAGELSPTSP